MTREEAIEIIKRNCTSDSDLRKACKLFIPELTENEDERIRREIIGYLTHRANVTGFISEDRDCKRWISYLEKQKELPTNEEMLRTLRVEYEKGVADTIAKYEQREQKPTECIPDSVKFEEGFKTGRELGFREGVESVKPTEWSEDNIKELTEFEAAMLHIGMSFFGGSAGLNPNNTNEVKKQAKLLLELVPKQEWSEEDEHYLHQLILFCENCMQQDSEAIRCATWLKSLPERFGLQPKQEWNKEDEDKMEQCITIVSGWEVDYDFTKSPFSNFLKSLRPQPKQEWSDEEKDKLNRIERIIVNANAHGNSIIGDKEAIELQHFIHSLVKPVINIVEWSEDKEIIRQNGRLDVCYNPEKYGLCNKTESIKDATKFGNLEYERGVKDGIQSEKKRHWKPSEKQLIALRYYLNHVPYSPHKEHLSSLRDDCEKLFFQ